MWEIASQGTDWVVLKSEAFGFRLAVPVTRLVEHITESTSPEVQIVHPCRTCGWANSCKEECHS